MARGRWTLLRQSEKAELWQRDLLDPSGSPVTLFEGSTFVRLANGERRQTPDRPSFSSLAQGEAWFENAAQSID
jgi:hypothetical protein